MGFRDFWAVSGRGGGGLVLVVSTDFPDVLLALVEVDEIGG